MLDEWGFPVDDIDTNESDEMSFFRQQQMAEQNLMQQQTMIMQQNAQYMQQEMNYSAMNAQQRYLNAVMRGKEVRYTGHEIVNGLKSYVYNISGGVMPRDLVKLEEFPQMLRHACALTKEKITYLPLYYFNIPEMHTRIPFYFCKRCARLYYPKELMNGGYY